MIVRVTRYSFDYLVMFLEFWQALGCSRPADVRDAIVNLEEDTIDSGVLFKFFGIICLLLCFLECKYQWMDYKYLKWLLDPSLVIYLTLRMLLEQRNSKIVAGVIYLMLGLKFMFGMANQLYPVKRKQAAT